MRTRAFQIGLLTGFIVLIAAQGTAAQERQPPEPNETATEGVAVHGHWKIEVVRDGQITKKLEFQNALTGSGESVLGGLISGRRVASGEYRIDLVDLDASTLECDDITTSGICVTIVQSEYIIAAPSTPTVLVEGSFSVTSGGTISRVLARLENCTSSATSPDNCDPNSYTSFSATDLASPESVQSGDTVNVSVEITFS